MIKVAQIQLKPDERQQEILTETLRTANQTCDEISSVTFEEKLFVSRHVLQQKTYYAGPGKVPLVIFRRWCCTAYSKYSTVTRRSGN